MRERVEVNWSLVLEYHERDPRPFSRKLCRKNGRKREKKGEGRDVQGKGYRGTGGKGTKLIAGACRTTR